MSGYHYNVTSTVNGQQKKRIGGEGKKAPEWQRFYREDDLNKKAQRAYSRGVIRYNSAG